MLFAGGGEGDVIVLGFGVVEFRYRNNSNLGAFAYRDAIEVLGGRARAGGEVRGGRSLLGGLAGQALLGAGQGGVEAVGAERFQKIIYGVDLEGFDCVIVVGGDENDRGFGADQLENFKAVEFGHLHVEEKKIGFLLSDGFYRLETVTAFADDFEVGMR